MRSIIQHNYYHCIRLSFRSQRCRKSPELPQATVAKTSSPRVPWNAISHELTMAANWIRMYEMPFPLQLNVPRLAQSFCVYLNLHTWRYIDRLWSQLWVSSLCTGGSFFSSSTRYAPRAVSLFHQVHVTCSGSFPCFCKVHVTRSAALRAQLLVTGCAFFSHSVAQKKKSKKFSR